MFDYTIESNAVTVTGYTGGEETLVIPTQIKGLPVTKIGKHAFEKGVFRRVRFPDTLEEIEDYAFQTCAALEEADFPASLRAIGHSAFSGCKSLRKITFASDRIDFGSHAFYRCASLEAFAFPPKTTQVPGGLIARCAALTEVMIPEGCVSLGRAVFGQDYGLRQVTLPASLRVIHPEVFFDCSAFCVRVPKGSAAEAFCRAKGYQYETTV